MRRFPILPNDPKVVSPLRRFASFLCYAACLCAPGTAWRCPAQQNTQTHVSFPLTKHSLPRRSSAPGVSAARARMRSEASHARAELLPRSTSFTAPWTALGPSSITSVLYGALSGRINAIAIDPNDLTGNTVFLGTSDGGVWKSTNAAGAKASVTFRPLTDTLPVYSQSAGSSTVPSLAIGALAIQSGTNGVVLAGTGDPNDSSDSLYGEGLLRSADGGLTWTLVQGSHDGANGNHSFSGLSTAGLAWSSSTPTLAVAAFTDSPVSAEEIATNSASVPGLYYSTDAGVTWKMATLYDGAQVVQTPQPLGTGQVGNAVTSVVWDALRGSFYAAVRAHGYYASADGMTWTRMASQPGAALTATNCPVGANGTGAATCPIFRGTLAVQPATGDLYALTVDTRLRDQGLWQDLCNATHGLCSNAAPAFASRIDGGAMEIGSGSTAITEGDYNLSLAAVPAAANATLLFAGAVDLYRCSVAAGTSACSLRNTTNTLNGCNAPSAVAASQHALAGVLLPGGSPLLFLGNDGGLWRSPDGVAETGAACSTGDASHFDNLNEAIGAGGSLAEVVSFAQSPNSSDVLLAGFGANGSASTIAASQGAAWPQMNAGEGGVALLDPVNPNHWYSTIGAGVNIKHCGAGTSCTAADFVAPSTVGEAQVSYDAALLDAPVFLDPALTSEIVTATCRVWRGSAQTGTTWSAANAISAAFGGGTPPCSANSPMVRSLAAGGAAATSANPQNAGSEVIYAGLAGALDGGTQPLGGRVYVTTTAQIDGNTTAWKDIAASPVTNDTANASVFNPYGFDVAALAVDPHDATGATVYAAIAGFGAGAAPHLYRSMDFGAHWLNVSANLPDAPANAVLVDPNDANTVYVAMDAGVYATQEITACATASCWNLLGTGLPNAPVTTLAAGAKLATGDGRLGMLRAGTYGRGIWQTPLLAAISTAAPAITLSASTLDFGPVTTGSTSAAQTVTVTSSGTSPLTIGSLTASGDFAETDTCASQTLAVNTTCTVTLHFAPTATGARSGALTIFANTSGGQVQISLTGTGTAPASPATIVLTPLSLTFAATTIRQTSASQIITVANTGGTAASLGTPTISGDFTVAANTCANTLAAQTACSIAIAFMPAESGSRSGLLSITSSAGTSVATLIGMGTAPATDTLAPLSLTFGATTIGSASSPLSVTLTNSGDAALTLITTNVSSAEFTATNNCGATLAARSTCAIQVSFVPTSVGSRSGTLTVSDQFRSQSVALLGTSIAGPGVSLTPTSVTFGATGVGLTSVAQVVTLTNNGGAALTLNGAVVSGDFVIAGNTCGAAIASSASCSLTIVFSPKAAGTRTGTLTLTDNAVGGSQTIALVGAGIDFTFAANGATTATVAASGGSATFPMLLAALGGVSASANLACSGAPAHASCLVTPSSATIGSALTVSAVVSTGTATSSLGSHQRRLPWMPAGVVLAIAIWPGKRRRWRAAMLCACVGAFLSGISGCGTGRMIPGDSSGGGSGTTPTPAGIYTLTISATAAGVTHSVPVTLTVQ